MATTAMVTGSRMEEWPSPEYGLRFCRNGHRVNNGNGFEFVSDSVCPVCGAKDFATILWIFPEDSNMAVPVPLKPIAVKRIWRAVEAFDRDGHRLIGVRQRIKKPVYDVRGIKGIWEHCEGNRTTRIPDPF